VPLPGVDFNGYPDIGPPGVRDRDELIAEIERRVVERLRQAPTSDQLEKIGFDG